MNRSEIIEAFSDQREQVFQLFKMLIDRCNERARRLPQLRGLYSPTAAEFAAAVEFDRYAAARRLPELRRSGRIKNGPPRKCSVTGRRSITWRLP